MNKKGSHVGFVISFMLFITFVIFMYLILNSRIDFGQDKANSLEYVKSEITERVSGSLTTASVDLNNPGSNCVELSNFLGIAGIGNRVMVRSDSGNILNAGISGQSLQVERNGNTFFRVYGSEEFSQTAGSLGSCQSLSEGQGYILGLVRDSEEIFESKIIALSNNYTGDYEALKKDMNIGSGDEFGFIFTYADGTAIKTPGQNVTINVYVDRIPVQYIKTNAAKENGFIDILVW
ncbi:MAG: hypothetical protein U1B79_01365 [Candidatus Pacearchaeota archaeon]|nr:hypothetical protein [Nanoarchaeota archaeon]MDZ4226740.1 hypothetical protein [Candidatus Pacearchaeota archaeon]